MIPLSQPRMKRMTAVHGWSAVLLGLLLYAVVFTGAVAVFAPEIGRWSAGTVRHGEPLAGPIDATVRRLAKEVDPAYLDDIAIWAGVGGDAYVFFHTHAMNPEEGELDDLGTIFRVDTGSGAVLERHDGFVWQDPPAWETSALRRFLIDLHVQLYLPNPWGLILTGVLGLMMMAAVITGFLMHRHLVRDLFVAERPGGRLVSARDRHVLAASWGLPFAFLLAFTGSFFSFASTIGFPLVATVAFGGDEEALTETLYEPPVPENAAAAPLASLDHLLADSVDRAGGAAATYVDITRFGRADARVAVWHEAPEGGLIEPQMVFDGPSRTFLGQKVIVGNGPSVGGALYGLMYPLHFGDFAGVLSQAVWGALGVAMCFVILSGLRLWIRRRIDQPLWRGFWRASLVTAYGLPLGVVAAAYGFFLSHPAGDPFFWTPWSFVLGAAVAILLGIRMADAAALGRRFQRMLAVACLLLPVLRLGTGGMTWSDALISRQVDVLSVDLLLLIAGGVLWLVSRREMPSDRTDAGTDTRITRLEPAE
ncbi:PepSY domain-containing protein [Amaricoccus sp.]|uniref:PepSY-associated TM helix domain-containing protein n=1 Tax=Amaricoccus sp. TaxID=1872485 RepID=UPI00261A561B|nr:PepSY-associated TM helix domain-containing protein [uncultured Amaricoccus sp.]